MNPRIKLLFLPILLGLALPLFFLGGSSAQGGNSQSRSYPAPIEVWPTSIEVTLIKGQGLDFTSLITSVSSADAWWSAIITPTSPSCWWGFEGVGFIQPTRTTSRWTTLGSSCLEAGQTHVFNWIFSGTNTPPAGQEVGALTPQITVPITVMVQYGVWLPLLQR